MCERFLLGRVRMFLAFFFLCGDGLGGIVRALRLISRLLSVAFADFSLFRFLDSTYL
jgi:hypothetical protein